MLRVAPLQALDLGVTPEKAQIKTQDERFMIRCRIPTYLIGVGEKAEAAWAHEGHATGSLIDFPSRLDS